MRTIELRDGEKLIGSRDGLFYLDEKMRSFSKFQITGVAFQYDYVYVYFHDHYYIGTYGEECMCWIR